MGVNVVLNSEISDSFTGYLEVFTCQFAGIKKTNSDPIRWVLYLSGKATKTHTTVWELLD